MNDLCRDCDCALFVGDEQAEHCGNCGHAREQHASIARGFDPGGSAVVAKLASRRLLAVIIVINVAFVALCAHQLYALTKAVDTLERSNKHSRTLEQTVERVEVKLDRARKKHRSEVANTDQVETKISGIRDKITELDERNQVLRSELS